VTLVATPTGTSAFQGWTGCDSVSGTTCNLTVTAARTVTATFVKSVPAKLTVVQVGSGIVASYPPGINCGANNVSPNLCSYVYTAGTEVTLTAAAGINQKFQLARLRLDDGRHLLRHGPRGGKDGDGDLRARLARTPVDRPLRRLGRGQCRQLGARDLHCDGSSPCTSNFLSGTNVVLSAAAAHLASVWVSRRRPQSWRSANGD
jgi:hypothetical protein